MPKTESRRERIMELKKPPGMQPVTISTFLLYRERYKVDPTYQRAPGVWETWREQYLIDSILRGYGIPLIFIHKRDGEEYIVDGQQRLLTIWNFYDDKLELNPKFSRDIIQENNGAKKHSELSAEYQNRFAGYTLGVAYLEDYDDEEIRSTFKRLQSGKSLSPGEKLNAYPGDIVPTMRTLGQHPFFEHTVALGLGRYKDYYLAAMFLMLESGGIKSTSPSYIYDFFDNNKNLDIGSKACSKVKKVLNYLRSAFDGRAGELRTQAWIVSTYLLASYLIDHYAMQEQQTNFRNFIARFYQEIAHIAESPKPEPELIQFNTAISRGTNNEETIKFRHRVFVRRFIKQYAPVELDEERIFSYDQKLAIFRKYDGVCQVCAENLEFGDSHTHYHHIDSYIEGGETEVENGLLVCQKCHLSKIHSSTSAL
jgi:hypothetical protein